MSLLSVQFLIFFLLIMTVYYILPGRFQWIWLFACSIFYFYITSSKYSTILFIVFCLLNWIASLYVCNRDKSVCRRNYIVILIFDIFFLCYFKYFGFFADIFYDILSIFIDNPSISFVEKLRSYSLNFAPAHISYFALIVIGYITDVYWGKVEVQKNPCKMVLFTSYFPQVLSGPIVTYENISDQLWGDKHRFDIDRFLLGMERVLWGIFKKLVIAERLGVIVGYIYDSYEVYPGFYIFIAAAFFALQLYCDFSGLMDIVLGYSECLGINLPENFQTPFYSQDLSEFWRRWHITLGAFLRDYVLYPIQRSKIFKNMRKRFKERFGKGYEKKCNVPLHLSLLISWFLIGLWHGGGYNYIFGVGIYMWAVIVVGDICKPLFAKLVSILHINTECFSFVLFRRIRTFLLFIFGLSFFRARTLTDGFLMWKSAFSEFNPWIFFDRSIYSMGLDRQELDIAVVGLILLFIVSFISQKEDVRELLHKQNYLFRIIVVSVLFVMTIMWGYYGTEFNAANFIYGRF